MTPAPRGADTGAEILPQPPHLAKPQVTVPMSSSEAVQHLPDALNLAHYSLCPGLDKDPAVLLYVIHASESRRSR